MSASDFLVCHTQYPLPCKPVSSPDLFAYDQVLLNISKSALMQWLLPSKSVRTVRR